MGVTTPMAFGLLLLRSWQRDGNLAVDGGDLRVTAVYAFGDVLPNLSLLFFPRLLQLRQLWDAAVHDYGRTGHQRTMTDGLRQRLLHANDEQRGTYSSVFNDRRRPSGSVDERRQHRSAKKETQQRTVAARTSSGMIRAVLPIRHYEQWCSGQQTPAIRSLWSSFGTMKLGFSRKQRKTCSNTILEKKRKNDMNEFRIQCGWLDFLLIISWCVYK